MKAMSARRLAGAIVLSLALGGCASSVQQWIVNARVHQGAIALERGDVRDAELAYRLALRVDPKDPPAQSGYVRAAAGYAQELYAKGDFDGALATIHDGLVVDPESVRLAALKRTIDQARLNREIVVSNYPSYREAGAALARSYEQLDVTNKQLLRSLKRFNYTFDDVELVNAIKRSYELQLDIAKNGNRLIAYRQLVTSGIPASTSEAAPATTSLLPLP